MGTTLTIRTDSQLRRAIESRAKQSGKTISEFVREILADALAERPMAERAAHVRGRLGLAGRPGEWRKQLRQRNWRP